jgi:hypothetical protein
VAGFLVLVSGNVKVCHEIGDDDLDFAALLPRRGVQACSAARSHSFVDSRDVPGIAVGVTREATSVGALDDSLCLNFRARSVFYPNIKRSNAARMSKPVIFTISAAWDDDASVWSGHCDDIPAAADAPTLDELLAKISAMALDLLPDNHPGVDPASLFLQITALREAELAAA